MKLYLLIPALTCLFFLNCKRRTTEDPIVPVVTPKPSVPGSTEPNDQNIKAFIWSALNYNYLWKDNVPALADNKFSNQSGFLAFLNGYSSNQSLFDGLLYQKDVVDKWSFLVSDYSELEKELNGVNQSMGYEFRLYGYSNSKNIFGVVMYVLKDSPAQRAGLKRGDIFTKVNNQYLDENNYKDLLIKNTSYNLGLAYLSNNTIMDSGTSPLMSAVEIHENPIFLDTVYTINGQNIGYLVYNAFVTDYDNALNQVFAKFKNQNINNLILDLRYNSGGYIKSAANLASMIYTSDTSKVFMYTKFNNQMQDYYLKKYGPDYSKLTFSDSCSSYNTPVAINSLNLNKLYVLTTGSTASSSELIINCLRPYISVVLIGTKTTGKNVGSYTIKDYDSTGKVNPNHKWALQPIVSKSSNSAGFSEYESGFSPDYELRESLANMSVLGNINEPLLSQAINVINGTSSSAAARLASPEFEEMGISRDYNKLHNSFHMGEAPFGSGK